ncbi:MAG: hypothetical protein JW728_07225 [Candidatus Aureabacteria bacterium]|nr:hypothetical protein [Candidatus Auribacterota bacterium]
MKMNATGTGLLLVFICIVTCSGGDEIILKTGEKIEGIVLFESSRDITFDTILGEVTLDNERIEKINRYSQKQNDLLKRIWELKTKESGQKEGRAIEQEQLTPEEMQLFEETQKARGLIKYKDEWYTKPALERLLSDKKKELEEKETEKEKGKKFEKLYSTEKEQKKMEKDAEKESKALKYVKRKQWDQSRVTEKFNIYYKRYRMKDNRMAAQISGNPDNVYTKLLKDMGIESYINWQVRCDVFLLDNESSWSQIKTIVGPSDSTPFGFSVAGDREIYIDPWGDTGLSGLQQTSDIPIIFSADVLFNYFLAEILWKEFLQDKDVPLWLIAGTASYYSGTGMYNSEKMEKDIKAKKYLSFSDLIKKGKYPKSEKDFERFVYESEVLVRILVNAYDENGNLAFCQFARMIEQGKSFKDAFEEIYKDRFESLDDLSKKWFQSLKGK